ncbi:PTS cellobiose transporter subunit IIC [Yokenella regensburgei]|uniref:Permease IIC component n=1 Tax=Yokenella regensburgei TaxID=158877 RepID=A0AB38FYY8_9ENTR|nr:PTS cellobiose transporter subunit IIC [Yokenella regensburgei]KFD25336.1 PTS system cellobiose-specific IIC component [Yokenella regensburgei ATCC 49455]SQA63372.1 PTS system oligo-beta-mannoside-specific EIIC component [Yokenella regensburgei]SQA68792.1 PTS system oligo-beta-mannoside-specific EIIC component [Yokenella regensburgei]SUQ07107.1 PTS system oligo-beta-mannoside-specific EIIC component [Yokenella regensburgei]
MSNSSWIERYVMPAALKIAGQKHVLSVRDGIILNMPFMLIGSFFLIFAYLPIPGYPEMMTHLFGDVWREKMLYPVKATYDIMALISSFGIAYRLAEKYRTLDPLSAGAMSLVAFVMTIPQHTLFAPVNGAAAQVVKGVIPVNLVGSQGLFVAIVIALLSTEIYRFVAGRNLVIRMPEGVPPAVAKSFLALVPGFCVLAVVLALRLLVEASPFGDINSMIATIIGIPMHHVGGTLPGMIISVILIGILWTLGLHGDAIVLVFIQPVWLSNMSENLTEFQNGQPIPHIITQQFYDLWIAPGGTGALLGLVIFMLVRSRSQQMKQLGKIAAPGALFNISEPMVFGIPLVMNPYFFLPFILTPVLLVIVSYTAMATGLVAPPAGIALPFTTPIFISGYLATGGHISGTVLQVVNLGISLVVYYPFFRVWDRLKLKEEQASLNKEKVAAAAPAGITPPGENA